MRGDVIVRTDSISRPNSSKPRLRANRRPSGRRRRGPRAARARATARGRREPGRAPSRLPGGEPREARARRRRACPALMTACATPLPTTSPLVARQEEASVRIGGEIVLELGARGCARPWSRSTTSASAARSSGEVAVSIVIGPKKFAEPVTLSSIEPTDLWLPPTAARLDFDLLALRARRKQQAIRSPSVRQEGEKRKGRNLRGALSDISQLDRTPIIGSRRSSGSGGLGEDDKLDFLGRTCLNRSRGRVHRCTR